ncbi:MAG: sel1 repeat family protein [Dechloromonas sp.]|uniref:tetratricopeptide repeat protein n=1 Tax=Dechloromonas sp. TaxID=1917218 RepID=UPI0027ED04C7|nr:tetratricopeptide repeat protein [Dechloromonas sp.]MBT9519826.1 sel1 repeat family protein [Dechloromonas sp.]
MKRIVTLILLAATFSSSIHACEHRAVVCELIRQVDAAQSPMALEKVEALAKEGNSDAQLALGTLYGLGKGVPQDDAKALVWLMQVARSGDPRAQSIVGNFYAAGRAGPIDLAEAKKWYDVAAKGGDPDAQAMLGLLYARGEGAPMDYATAYYWFTLASIGGAEKATEYMNLVRPYLTPVERSGAEEKVKTWKPVRTIMH